MVIFACPFGRLPLLYSQYLWFRWSWFQTFVSGVGMWLRPVQQETWIWFSDEHVSCISQDLGKRWNSQIGLPTFPEVWAGYRKTVRDSAIPEVTYSGSLVPPRGCRGKIEELLLRVKEGKMCGKSWGRTCDYWPRDIANPCTPLQRDLGKMTILTSFVSPIPTHTI